MNIILEISKHTFDGCCQEIIRHVIEYHTIEQI